METFVQIKHVLVPVARIASVVAQGKPDDPQFRVTVHLDQAVPGLDGDANVLNGDPALVLWTKLGGKPADVSFDSPAYVLTGQR